MFFGVLINGIVPSSALADPQVDTAPSAPTEKATAAPTPLATKSAAEKKPDSLDWDPRWPEVKPYEYILTGVFALAAIGGQAIPGGPRWTGHNAFDDAGREALLLPDFEDQERAKDFSDVGLVILVNQALIDNLFVTWWARDHPKTAWQLSVIDTETLAFSIGVDALVAGATGRERPYVEALCDQEDHKNRGYCDGSNRYRSFFSGHSTAAFTLAGLTCIHHAELGIYGHPVADAFACGGAMATATGVALLRVASDQHDLSDVLVGAVWGTATGVTLPWLLHYRGGAKVEEKKPDPHAAVEAPPPGVVVTPSGAYVMGAF
ncbi:MAG: phosphatase PAP2 family protein [Polyangiaceae bacterium]